MIAHFFFHLYSVAPLDLLAGGKELNFFGIFKYLLLSEEDGLECAYYFSCTNKFTEVP